MRNELRLFVCTLEEQPPESWFANATVSDIKKAPKDIGEWHNIQKYSTTIVSAKIDLRSKSHSTSLMKHRINLISILHVKLCGSLFSTETPAIKKKSNGLRIHGLAVTVGMHQLLQCGCAFDPEEHLSTILQISHTLYVTHSHS
jgi:hypothetical protein